MRVLALLWLCACQGGSVPLGSQGVHVRGEDAAERLEKALGAVKTPRPHDSLMQSLVTAKGPILVDAPDKVSGLENLTLEPLVNAENEALWWGRDGEAVAKSLRARKVRYVLLHRAVTPSIDRNGAVLSRLYHDDFRQWFTLIGVDERLLMYRVLDAPYAFSLPLAHHTIRQIRTLVRGETAQALPEPKAEDGKKWNLILVARRPGGREIAVGMCYRESYRECVAELARDLEKEYRRTAEWYGLERVEDVVDELILELHRVVDRARISAFDGQDLLALWEMGIDGGLITQTKDRKVGVLPGSVSYTRAYRDPDQLLRTAAKTGRLDSKRPWREEGNTLDKIRTVSFVSWPGKGTMPHLRGTPYVPMEAVDLPALENSVVMSGDWYLANLQENGQVTYKFWPSENRYSNEYNLVRHTLATWNMVQAWNIDKSRTDFLEGAERALDWTLQWRVDEGDMSFIHYNNNRKLGSVVVGLMGMIDLARATGDKKWDDLMVRFGNFTLFMQEESGKFDPYYVPDDHPYANNVNDIVPGEAALALVMLYEYTGDEKWLAPLPKFFAYYMPWWEERVTQKRDDATWPFEVYHPNIRLELVQFGPWSVMAANAYHRVSGDTVSADFGLSVARWMLETYQWDLDRSPWPDYVGGFYKMQHELPAMQAFCYAEGTAAAYQLALRHRPEDAAFFEERTRQTMRFALQMQYDEGQVYPFSRASEVLGGTRYALNETKVRIDYVHHQLSSVYQYIMAAREDPNLPADVVESPMRKQLKALAAEAAKAPQGG